jgi:hypothetical protein
MACGAIITMAALAALAGCGSSGSDGADTAGPNGLYGAGGPFAATAAKTPAGVLAGAGQPSRVAVRVDGSTAMEGRGYRVPWLPALGSGVSVSAPRSVRPGTATPANAATGFYQAFYAKRLTEACGFVGPAQRAGCPSALAAASARAGTLRSPAIGFVVTKGATALVTMTGVACGANGAGPGHCVAQRDPGYVFGPGYSFGTLWDQVAKAGGNPLTATPFQRVAGRWYLDLAPAAG